MIPRILACALLALTCAGCVSDSPSYEPDDEQDSRYSAQQLYDLGLDYFRGGKFDLAERQFLHCLEKDPEHAAANLALANTNFYMAKLARAKAEKKIAVDRLNMAIRRFELATVQLKDSAEPYMGLGLVYLENAAFHTNAIENLEKALALEPDNQEKNLRAHFYLGSAYGLVGEFKKSITHYQTYLDMFPFAQDWDEVSDILLDLHRKLGLPYEPKRRPSAEEVMKSQAGQPPGAKGTASPEGEPALQPGALQPGEGSGTGSVPKEPGASGSGDRRR